MKRLAIAALFSITTAVLASGCNLAPNPSFEDGISAPAGWRLMSSYGQEDPTWDTGIAHTGHRSLRIDIPADSGAIGSGWHSDPIPVDISQQYCFGVWAKASPSLLDRVVVVLTIRELDAHGNPSAGLGSGPYNRRNVSTEWAELRRVKARLGEAVDAGAGWRAETANAILDITFFAHDQRGLAGTIWLDDVFFGECDPDGSGLTPPSNLSANIMYWDSWDPETGQMSGGCGGSLLWKNNSGNEVGFRIERRIEGRIGGSEAWELLEEVPADSQAYLDESACQGFCYRVAAVGASGVSEYSSEACLGP